MDAAGQLAQLDQGILGVLARGADQFAGGRDVGDRARVAELLGGHAQVHGERGQPDLRAVVQVALKAAEPFGGIIHR